MKKSILLSLILLVTASMFAQIRSTSFTPSRSVTIPYTAERGEGDTIQLSNLGVEDTSIVFYYYNTAPNWGFSTGHNSFGDVGWGEKYEVNSVDSTFDVIGVVGYFHGTVSASSTTKFASFGVYSADSMSGGASPISGLPGTQLTVVTKAYTDIDVSGSAIEYTPIVLPVHVDDDFFVTYELEPYNPIGIVDTIGLFVTLNGSRPGSDTLKNGQPFSRNAVRWNDGKWYDEHYQNSGALVNYILFPIVIVSAADTVSVGVSAGITRSNLTYKGNYPNPATTVSNMRFYLSDKTPVTINVYDMNGKLMLTKEEGEMLAGDHTVALDIAHLAAGSYLVSIATIKATIGGMFQVVK